MQTYHNQSFGWTVDRDGFVSSDMIDDAHGI